MQGYQTVFGLVAPDLEVDSPIRSSVVEIVDMFLALRDLVAEAEEKMQGYYVILGSVILDL